LKVIFSHFRICSALTDFSKGRQLLKLDLPAVHIENVECNVDFQNADRQNVDFQNAAHQNVDFQNAARQNVNI
jgi:uncharacterized protein YjbI with pentapeptide repeats